MPRVKRYHNAQKLATQEQIDAHIPTMNAPIHSSSSIPSQAPASSLPTDEVSRQQASTESSNPSVDSKRYVGRESTRYWNVQTIDSENVTKKKNITVKEVNNLPRGERIIVEFDREGAACGEAQGVLAGYCGILASDSNLFPISFEKWSGKLGMPNTYKKECFQTMIKSRFFFRTSEKEAYKYCNASLSKKWATNRYRIWNEFYNPAETRDQLISNVPTGIQRDQWAAFITYRLKPSTVELCQKNKESRSKQIIPHTCGSKSNSRRRHELFLETGKYPSRGRIYIDTHKRKNGSFVNDEARDTVMGQPLPPPHRSHIFGLSTYSPEDGMVTISHSIPSTTQFSVPDLLRRYPLRVRRQGVAPVHEASPPPPPAERDDVESEDSDPEEDPDYVSSDDGADSSEEDPEEEVTEGEEE